MDVLVLFLVPVIKHGESMGKGGCLLVATPNGNNAGVQPPLFPFHSVEDPSLQSGASYLQSRSSLLGNTLTGTLSGTAHQWPGCFLTSRQRWKSTITLDTSFAQEKF